MRKCIQCESYFKPSSKLNALCSEKCARTRRALQTKGHKFDAEQTCAHCGKTFNTTKPNQKSCSAECSRENRLTYLRKWHEADAKRREEEVLRLRCAEILAAVPPGAMTEAEGMEYARNELESKRQRKTRAGRRKAKKECVHCGNPFSTANPNQINCSKECGLAHKAERRKAIYSLLHKKAADPTCVHCGNPITSSGRRLTCSAECARERQKYTPRPREKAERECVHCGKKFSTRHHNKISCSAECARERHVQLVHRRYTPRPREETQKKCAQCGNAFKTSHPRKHTCGRKCAKIWNRERTRLRRKRQAEGKKRTIDPYPLNANHLMMNQSHE